MAPISELTADDAAGGVAHESRADNSRTVFFVLVMVAVLLVVPLLGALGLRWAEHAGVLSTGPAKPQWLSFNNLQATTTDGIVVRARIAIDVRESDARDTIESEQRQIGLALELCLASFNRERISGPEGMQALSNEMRRRLNVQLDALGSTPAVRHVAIQELLISKP